MELKSNPLHTFATIASLTRTEGTSSTKRMLNALFSCLVAQKTKMPKFSSTRYQVLYLDGPSARTTTQLIRAGIDRTKLLPVSHDESAYRECKKLAPYAGWGQLSMAIGDTGIDNGGEPLAGIWLDYCGTFKGNNLTKVYPIRDIRQILRHYLTENSILALTFCLRDRRNRSREQTKEECITGVGKLLREYKYSPDLSKVHITQYGNMMFMMYDLKKMPGNVVDEDTMDVADECATDEETTTMEEAAIDTIEPTEIIDETVEIANSNDSSSPSTDDDNASEFSSSTDDDNDSSSDYCPLYDTINKSNSTFKRSRFAFSFLKYVNVL